ncbi:TonB-dependent receptor plug domain-containing protein [Flavobacterium algicola]|uniref:TonB-dependent receptor plug domain-containing protein n=1 Tax=Flavobacterium algicola TaxID=556529 RepID=UPI001EFDB819|nr:TonB-dependent receptor [Flavobacterium algicola]MCG9794029.1 TonB-dependent receptor [Flavobacterium algicola]
MKHIYLLVGLLSTQFFFGQKSKDTIKNISLNEIKINTDRYSETKTFQKIATLSQIDIAFQNTQSTADLLANSGTVTIQKSQQGGGSPVIRGLEANRILLLVDGIRMNNLIFRAGHLQNVITIDGNMLQEVAVLFGPSSTFYGSDAMGGAINLKTKDPLLLNKANRKISGNLFSRYSSTNDEKTNYVDFNIALNKWAFLTAVSTSNFGDLRMGAKKNGNNDFFGERLYYVVTENNVDRIEANSNKLIQKYSGYKQYNLMQKIIFQQNEKMQHGLNFQYATSSDIPRYDRLTDLLGTNGLNSARWDYGPQKRLLAAYKMNSKDLFLNTDLNFGLHYQTVEESRITRKFNSDNTKTQLEKVNVFGASFDLKSHLGLGELLYGAEFFYDNVQSIGSSQNRKTGEIVTADSRYPNGLNNTVRTDIFAIFTNAISPRTSYNIAARTGFVNLKSTIKDNSIFQFPFTAISQSNLTYSGALGLISKGSFSKVSFNLASAFRVPNIDDVAKLFESVPGTLIVPNQDLKPEKSITADLTISLFKNKLIQLDNTFYYTRLYDVIVTDAFTYNNQSTIIYEGVSSVIQANQNQGKAYITGFNTSLKVTIAKPLSIYANFNFTEGKIVNESNNSPLDHIPPVYGKAGIVYDNEIAHVDFYLLYNGSKNINKYLLNGEDNEKYAPAGGMPGWKIFNLKGSFAVLKSLQLSAGIENIMDIQYRTFSSGINASGRNIYFGMNYKF